MWVGVPEVNFDILFIAHAFSTLFSTLTFQESQISKLLSLLVREVIANFASALE